MRDISSVLMISGLLLFLDAGLTLVWQEPVTAVIGLVKRSEIDKQYLSFQTAPLTPVERHVLVKLPDYSQRIAYLARREQHQVGTGDAIGHISIPRIGASYDVVQGTDDQYHQIVLPTALWVTNTWVTSASCCRPATRSTARPSGSSSSPS